MTQLRCRDGISNYFDLLLAGIGRRGSSFTDIDAITHDGDLDRFLVQEFKHGSELPLSGGQWWTLKALSRIPNFTVWLVVRGDVPGEIGWCVVPSGEIATISEGEYQAHFRSWWSQQ